jgi:3-deoxy-7-phosphoheptulonate synthase
MSPNEKAIKLPTPEQILNEYPLLDKQAAVVEEGRNDIKEILDGRSGRKLLIVGPCSAWPQEAVIDFARRLAPVAEKVKDRILVVMRGYIQKPRTIKGWTGPLVQPDPYESSDIGKGIRYCRNMLLQVLNTGLPVADEMLFTHNGGYFDDILSYLAIGARSSEDSEHRYVASALDIPVGIKNPTSGNAEIGVNSLIAAQSGHTFAMGGYQVESSGNPYAHLILRGGSEGPNYSLEAIENAAKRMSGKVKNPAIVVDVSHDNCKDSAGKKDHMLQPSIIRSTIESMRRSPTVARYLKGWMVEAFLADGNQNHEKVPKDQLVYGQSITDSCISFEVLQRAIGEIHAKL